MTNPRVYKGRLFYDGSYTDEFQWVKYDEVKHLLHHEPSATQARKQLWRVAALDSDYVGYFDTEADAIAMVGAAASDYAVETAVIEWPARLAERLPSFREVRGILKDVERCQCDDRCPYCCSRADGRSHPCDCECHK